MATTINMRRRRFVTVMTAFLAVAIVSVAFAAWVADGSGTGAATSREHQAVTINGDADVENLYPGDEKDLVVTIDNGDNPYNVTVQTITVGIDDDTCADEDSIPGNEDPDLSYGSYTIAGDSLVVAGGGTATVTLEDAIAMGHASGDDCQGESWTVDLSFTGESTGVGAANPTTLSAE